MSSSAPTASVDTNPKPKLFISYSWTSPDHEAWVLRLATELRESGVDAILDKWDLREGHDAHAFMEKMVTDPKINKVILICDKLYVEKADWRSGGVGTEAQIISAEIYARQDQEKFVAIVVERDENGRAYLPAYYRSRIYIDLTDASKYSENFDRLLRWAFDRPLYIKPEIGNIPAFLTEGENAVTLATSSRFKRAVDAVRNHRESADAFSREYLSCLASEIEQLRIDPASDPFDEHVIKSVENFLPFRNEAIELFLSIALHGESAQMSRNMHGFFEQLIPYLHQPSTTRTWNEWDFDNFRFVVHELFLYAIACLIRYERFDSAAFLMSTDYYVPREAEYGRDSMVSFRIFSNNTPSLTHRNQRLGLRRLSLRTDLLEQRCKGVGIEFSNLMQADFVLFLHQCLFGNGFYGWWPETLSRARRQPGPFEIFARSRSKSYFDRVKVLLGVDDKDELKPLIESFQNGKNVPAWQYQSFSPAYLVGYDQIATKL